MRKYLVVIGVLLMVGFLASSLWADPRGHRGDRRAGDHARQTTRQTRVTRPFVGVNRHYTSRYRDRYTYRRPTYGYDGAFRVLPYSTYYGCSTPQYVVPHSYYYYYDYGTPRGSITFTWSW